MTRKIVVAKSGYNAETDTNPRHLRFSSDYNTLKYDIRGSQEVSVLVTGGVSSPLETEEITIPHNLGYAPFFTASVKMPDEYELTPNGLTRTFVYTVPLYFDRNYYGENPRIYECEAYADSTNLYLRFRIDYDPDEDTTYYVTFLYRIFKNKLFD